MGMTSNWHEMTPSQFPWEREALEFIRERLPDHEPYQAWSNFEFIADDGSLNEVDLLVVTPNGFFMVEIKSQPGRLDGDQTTWKWTTPEGKRKVRDNPLVLTNQKAKKFKSMLDRQKALAKIRCPFLEVLVFVSAENLEFHLAGNVRQRVCPRDLDDPAKPGIVSAMKNRDALGMKQHVTPVNKPTSRAIGRAIEQMGIRPSQKSRKVGDYVLKELLFQCPKNTYQEWKAEHVSMKGARPRRVRIYSVALHESEQTRQLIQHAAEKEFQLLEQLSHEGILKAEYFTMHEMGPALIFGYDPEAVRLDHFLADRAESLSMDVRLSLVRQIAEALRFAHGKGIVHRILSPQSILVSNPDSDSPRIQIFNWQLGRQYLATTSASTLRHTFSIHPDQLIEDTSLLYMAPESITDPESVEPYADVFSLGAIAYHVFGMRPPAESAKELAQKLQEQRGLSLSAIIDGAGEQLCELITYSTHPEVSKRYDTIDYFLEQLELVEEEFTAPDEDFIDNPLEALKGDRIEGGFEILKKLGTGGSSTAFYVRQGDRKLVLKVSNKPEYADRLEAEYHTLKKLRHPLIVEAYELVDLGSLKGMTCQYAGDATLSMYLRTEGRVHLEFLERFGTDLLDGLKHLEDRGIYHRDIKPENIGIGSARGKGKTRLMLFDFSLSSTPLDNTAAGTVKYKDPFLDLPKTRKYDLYAERYSAALTLYEMATGQLPKWGDGKSDPAMLDCEVTVESEAFEAGIRGRMRDFFAKALRRDHRKRFDNADEMLKAWRGVFEQAETSTTTETQHPEEFDQQAAIETADLKTQLVTLGLSTRTMNATDRLNVVTVEDLLRFPIFKFYRLRGVGKKTRDEITQLARALHRRFPEIPSVDEAEDAVDTVVPPESLSVDVLYRDAISTGGKSKSAAKDMLFGFLGVGEEDSMLDWPTQSDLGRHFGVTRARAGQVVTKAREAWSRLPSLRQLRDDLNRILDDYGGVLSVQDLAAAVLAARGASVEEPLRTRRAMAAIRAAVEAERTLQEPRFSDHRSGSRVVISRGSALVRYAEELGKLADELAAIDPLPGSDRVLEKMRQVPRSSEEIAVTTDNELLRLAAYMSESAAVSSKNELYPKGMDALRALRLASGALTGTKELTPEAIQKRVWGRYPESEPLPPRPNLDGMLKEVGLELNWLPNAGGGKGAYQFPQLDSYNLTSASYGTGATHTLDVDLTGHDGDAELRLFEQKLRRSVQEGSYLVIRVDPRYLQRAEAALQKVFGVEACNLDQVLIPEMKSQAEAKKVKWDVVLRADHAEPDGADGRRLRQLVSLCVPAVENALQEPDHTILLTYPGLLARYGQIEVLGKLRDRIGIAGSPLHGLWVLLPEDSSNALPTLNGQAVPVISSGQHTRVPNAWIKRVEAVA